MLLIRKKKKQKFIPAPVQALLKIQKPIIKMFGRAASSAWTTLKFPLNEEADPQSSMSSIRKSKNNNSSNNKRRFNDDQIRSLETIFETESRPELGVKQQLANKLGLQPRQVGIWFQNKRARSKSKQIEQDYSMLKVSYDNLASRFESLKKENQSLIVQLQKLRKLAMKIGHEEYETEDDNLETNGKPDFLRETYSCKVYMSTCKDTSENVDYHRQESTPHDLARIVDGSLTSTKNGCSFESNELLDNSSVNSQWWEL